LPISNLPLDGERLWSDIMALAELTEPERPYTRRSFTPLFLEGRAWLAKRFAEAGLRVHIDTAGNLIGRLDGADASLGVIAVGSHSDTVPAGGRFDGIAGVATGLEVVRALRDAGIRLDHSLEVVDFLAEEPSEYGLSCVGSRGMTGALEPRMLSLTDPDGETLGVALRRVGGDPERLARARRNDMKAFLELHIEQGVRLESRSLGAGIVTAIVGIRRVEIVFEGEADHAGTTPMNLRRDALVAAADTVVSVRQLAEQLAARGPDYFVATVGILTATPGASNIVPGRCRLIVDIRSSATELIREFVTALERASAEHAAAARVVRQPLLTLSDAPPTACDPNLCEALRQAALGLGIGAIDLVSGAGHDAAFMSRICPSAMVFVPSRNGKSHSPDEWTGREEIAIGAAVVLEAVKALDQSLPRTRPRGSAA
jgi:beta-ureidopropionase / N-carbamoyl-L-amino-acid hydrolase